MSYPDPTTRALHAEAQNDDAFTRWQETEYYRSVYNLVGYGDFRADCLHLAFLEGQIAAIEQRRARQEQA